MFKMQYIEYIYLKQNKTENLKLKILGSVVYKNVNYLGIPSL